MDYSNVPNEQGLIETPFTQIKEGDNFFVQGDDTLYRARCDTTLNDSGDAFVLMAEDIDFNQKPFGVAKNSTGYAPRFYVVPPNVEEE